MAITKQERRARIKKRIRKVITGTKEKPRLSVFRSNKHIYTQFINDDEGRTMLSVSSLNKEIAEKKGIQVNIPENFYMAVAERHIEEPKIERKEKLKSLESLIFSIPETRKLYYEDAYLTEFEAKVLLCKKRYLILDNTAFYPEGGGQPSDVGFLEWNDKKSEVREVIKKGDTIKHIVEGEKPPEKSNVYGIINWDRRYNHMKMHTAQHIISGIVFDYYKARTVGNQIHSDYSRVDFHPAKFSEGDLKDIEKKFNRIVIRNLPIKIYEEERENLEKRVDQQRCNLDLLPKFITKLRIVEIEDFDICPCAGTHVKNTSEIPEIIKTKKESKGRDIDRIIYSFLP